MRRNVALRYATLRNLTPFLARAGTGSTLSNISSLARLSPLPTMLVPPA